MGYYSNKKFATELMSEIGKKPFSLELIGEWASKLLFEDMIECESKVSYILQQLCAMSMREEFEMKKEDIEKIAVDLLIKNK